MKRVTNWQHAKCLSEALESAVWKANITREKYLRTTFGYKYQNSAENPRTRPLQRLKKRLERLKRLEGAAWKVKMQDVTTKSHTTNYIELLIGSRNNVLNATFERAAWIDEDIRCMNKVTWYEMIRITNWTNIMRRGGGGGGLAAGSLIMRCAP